MLVSCPTFVSRPLTAVLCILFSIRKFSYVHVAHVCARAQRSALSLAPRAICRSPPRDVPGGTRPCRRRARRHRGVAVRALSAVGISARLPLLPAHWKVSERQVLCAVLGQICFTDSGRLIHSPTELPPDTSILRRLGYCPRSLSLRKRDMALLQQELERKNGLPARVC